jgi:hypothetical protein
LFYAESTNVLTTEEKTNLLKEHLRKKSMPERSFIAERSAQSAPPADGGGFASLSGARSGSFLVPATPTNRPNKLAIFYVSSGPLVILD